MKFLKVYAFNDPHNQRQLNDIINQIILYIEDEIDISKLIGIIFCKNSTLQINEYKEIYSFLNAKMNT